MGLLTNIEEQAHIVVPVFFILLLYINNMPIDFNLKFISLQEIYEHLPKSSFKNMLMILSFTIFLLLLETGMGDWKWRYLGFVIILVLSLIFYSIYYLTGYKNVEAGEINGLLKGYINDITIENFESAMINIATSTSMIIFIAILYYLLINHGDGQYKALFISLGFILCISVLYLKAEGVLALINYILKLPYWELWKDQNKKIDMGKISYLIFIGILLFLTLWGGFINQKGFIHYLNPYANLAKDIKHPILSLFILLIVAYMFRNKKMSFVLFTILLIVWEYLYDKHEFVKNNIKKTLAGFIALFLFIDGGVSSNLIKNDGDEIKKSSQPTTTTKK